MNCDLHRPDLDNFVLVYTMGKVGSTAIARSLEKVGIFCRHLQWLTPQTQTFLDTLWTSTAGEFDMLQNRLNVSRCRHALRDPEYASLIKVVTSVRSPVEQILSHYFHSLDLIIDQLRRRRQDASTSTILTNILECADAFMSNPGLGTEALARQLTGDNRDRLCFHWIVNNCLNWFETEFHPFFPAAAAEGFSHEGYMIAGNALIVKFEELATSGQRAIASYVQRPGFELMRDNVGADRATGSMYREVLRTIRFARGFVEHLCESEYTRRFYSEAERDHMLTRWAVS
jgi:hypothetical protein